MARMDAVPEGSVYFWCYRQGLKHVPLKDVMRAVAAKGKALREKDVRNYWNGWQRSDLYSERPMLFRIDSSEIAKARMSMRYSDFPMHPYARAGIPDVEQRWVPCNESNKPIIKWGEGCMTYADAWSMRGCRYMAENLKGTRKIVIDVDGDHGYGETGTVDLETLVRFYPLMSQTECMAKPTRLGDLIGAAGYWEDYPVSFHLAFEVDRVVPTMHFPYAHIDIVGNKENSLRYIKNKRSNGLPPMRMTNDLWSWIMDYLRERKER